MSTQLSTGTINKWLQCCTKVTLLHRVQNNPRPNSQVLNDNLDNAQHYLKGVRLNSDAAKI